MYCPLYEGIRETLVAKRGEDIVDWDGVWRGEEMGEREGVIGEGSCGFEVG
jgi:hypothetical protein